MKITDFGLNSNPVPSAGIEVVVFSNIYQPASFIMSGPEICDEVMNENDVCVYAGFALKSTAEPGVPKNISQRITTNIYK